MENTIRIRGAREHNLKNINLEIPRDKLVVITGLSGSGKSSLAFDTIYAEGQRRYVESLSAYARQFLGQMDKPDVDYIEGLSPAISIDQKTTSRNPRSTVGTVTEIYDYLRLLFARAGRPHCPKCGKPIAQQTVDQMLDRILALPERTKFLVMAQVVRSKKGQHRQILDHIRREGYGRVRIDGVVRDLGEEIELEKNKKHTIEVVVDRMTVHDGIRQRLADSLETALKLGDGVVYVQIVDGELLMFSQNFACVACGISLPEIAPRLFSFNSPYGACPACSGIGSHMEFDLELVLPEPELSFAEGVFAPLSKNPSSYAMCQIAAVLEKYGYTLDTRWRDVKKKVRDILLYGSGDEAFDYAYENMYGEYKEYHSPFEGVMPMLSRRYREAESDEMREAYENFMTIEPCQECHGARLKPETLAVTVGGKNIYEVTQLTIRDGDKFFSELALTEREAKIAAQILKEIHARLGFLIHVGLDYLTLSRAAGSLSGGEAQRIRLATQIGSGLVGVLYILDEPSIGLHQRDNDRLLAALRHLCDLGNTLLVVEHDEDTMREADYLIDIGPGAGINGGKVVAQGTPKQVMRNKKSLTAQYLNGKIKIEVPEKRRKATKEIVLKNAKGNNLKNVTAHIPLEVLTVVTGVSGSGKSTLINQTLFPELHNRLNKGKLYPLENGGIDGLENLEKVIDIDQSPIGRTPRSNTATYTKIFDDIRDLFSQTNDAKVRGYSKGRFSFNVKGGRCEACSGAGINKIEMNFLPDVYVECEVCKGKRYNRETLEVQYKGKSIADVLEMTVEEAYEFFKNIPSLERKLQTLMDVGMNYIQLGQPATTLSGGEAQRIKLATELSKMSRGKTIYILDEPTTGLHFEDIRKLLEVLNRLVDKGNTVLVIEHNLDVIKVADHIIDIGPEGGYKGGQIIAEGTPEEIAKNKKSWTGKFLKKYLKKDS